MRFDYTLTLYEWVYQVYSMIYFFKQMAKNAITKRNDVVGMMILQARMHFSLPLQNGSCVSGFHVATLDVEVSNFIIFGVLGET